MAFSNQYRKQVSLLVKILPHVATEACFALKGGTAIKLFLRNLPRLSIDIDLTYLPLKERSPSLAEIEHALKKPCFNHRCPRKSTRLAKGRMSA